MTFLWFIIKNWHHHCLLCHRSFPFPRNGRKFHPSFLKKKCVLLESNPVWCHKGSLSLVGNHTKQVLAPPSDRALFFLPLPTCERCNKASVSVENSNFWQEAANTELNVLFYEVFNYYHWDKAAPLDSGMESKDMEIYIGVETTVLSPASHWLFFQFNILFFLVLDDELRHFNI